MSGDTLVPPPDLGGFTTRLGDDLVLLDGELHEVDILIVQARTEAARHETRRTTTSDKLATIPADGDVKERLDLATSLVMLTKRAALMDSQVDVLEGKRRALGRYRDAVASYLEAATRLDPNAIASIPIMATLEPGAEPVEVAMPAAVSRLVMTAQEDLQIGRAHV